MHKYFYFFNIFNLNNLNIIDIISFLIGLISFILSIIVLIITSNVKNYIENKKVQKIYSKKKQKVIDSLYSNLDLLKSDNWEKYFDSSMLSYIHTFCAQLMMYSKYLLGIKIYLKKIDKIRKLKEKEKDILIFCLSKIIGILTSDIEFIERND